MCHPPGGAWYFLHRGLNCGGNGSLEAAAVCPGFDCGNGALEAVEVCDAWDLNCDTCFGQGFSGGMLSCNATRDGYDTSQCDR